MTPAWRKRDKLRLRESQGAAAAYPMEGLPVAVVQPQERSLRLGAYELSMSRTLVMGVLNVTPDSFSDGGLYANPASALARAHEMVAEGADIIDVGGESTRPGAEPVPEEEELRRVLPVVEALTAGVDVPVSLDTRKPAVAARCLKAGAVMINDVSSLRDPEMLDVIADTGAAVAIMHMKGTPQTMVSEAVYTDVLADVRELLGRQAALALEAGARSVMVDPGLGFAKTAEHNLTILNHLDEFTSLGLPLLVGPSRKSFIGHLTGLPVEGRTAGTIAAVTACVLGGADVVRVHDVGVCKQAIMVADAIRRA